MSRPHPQGESAETPLYILMISLHGLLRGHDMQLGCDADTGGQITYVVEMSCALAAHPQVGRVDLLTRLIEDADLAADYAQAEEPLAPGARIIRLPFGPRRYLRKELLWPHLDQLVDRCLHFLRQQGRLPDLIHSHYADAGYVGQQLSLLLGIPQVHTGHSLGRPKQARLLASGRKAHTIAKQYNFGRRIAAEEEVLQHASLIVTSTRQEIDDQYGMYQQADRKRFAVIPPGTDTSRFSPPGRSKLPVAVQALVDRFLSDADKPLILTICRPDLRKNLKGLLKAYGENKQLQQQANLLIVAGTRDDISGMEASQRQVMTELLLDIDRYDLWGKVAIPKVVDQQAIPDLYRLAARRRGVFVNAALTEPFGLTLIEAAASGLPFVAPDDGGPRDIVANCRSGLLANTLDSDQIAHTLLALLGDSKQWRQRANAGLAGVWRHYSWSAHVSQYMKEVRKLLRRDRKRWRRQLASHLHSGRSALPVVERALVSDIDNTLIGDDQALMVLIDWLRSQRDKVAFGIATGRTLESAVRIFKQHRVPMPDVLITSVGSEIHYGAKLTPDKGWAQHIRHLWRRDALAAALAELPGLRLQAAEHQREFKLSYITHPQRMLPMQEIARHLQHHRLQAQLIYSHGEFLDVLPVRASKGHAIRYLAYRWGLPLQAFLVAGDSGNDQEMLIGDTLGVVVGNHSPELAPLRGLPQVYFAEAAYAAGILQGLSHYRFEQAFDNRLSQEEHHHV
ncbi:HAD-IIB family hydrolase [Pseudomethylobacillus aquaticus]|uniref:sucrose-phosphate synthase n=1 Tax=Pseudomethylobacillus aquaticus TaxID=2676064 RepID=A0A3N0V6S8_9PROT|nr:HAD-IIB family hydrolase [Pseudomethylobacillus aquaticus]ROH88311.1 HAD-IIB family hydrolase [Pseudomethylobacillus aquaticus]